MNGVAQLCAYLSTVYKLTTSNITTHRQNLTDGSRSDTKQFPFEGTNGFLTYYWQLLGKGEEFVIAEKCLKHLF